MSHDARTPDQLAEEAALHAVWRRRFHHEVRIADHTGILTRILLDNGVPQETIDRAITDERARRGLD
ncbi:hypothetical protein [Brevundimonas sp. GCM10030266]|uniref:hypothetical protein n=1 Tax=Brevundimonas sp. GCM10030266 TaxID=3273386 RepID=UPI00361C21EA